MISLLPSEHYECNARDAVRGLAAALSPRDHCETLELVGLGSCIPLRSARAGIIMALRVLGLTAGARIGVPLFCCPVVFKAIEAAGCTLEFIDTDPATFCMSALDLAAKRTNVDAIVAVHMFGNVCDVPALRKAMPDKVIIEDCAQSLGSSVYGKLTGSFGEVGVFSFHSGKYLSAGKGGAVFTNDPVLRSRLWSLISSQQSPSRLAECLHVSKVILRSMLRRRLLYGLVGYPVWRFYNRKVEYLRKSAIVLGQMYQADLAVVRQRLTWLETAIATQRANADVYTSRLEFESSMLRTEVAGMVSNRYLYPVTFLEQKHRDQMASHLRRHGVDSIKYLDEISDVARNYHGYRGDCPVAERLSKTVLILPSYYALAKCEIERIAALCNQAWSTIRPLAYGRRLVSEEGECRA